MTNYPSVKLEWIEPDNPANLQALRTFFRQTLVARLEPEVMAVWESEVPEAGRTWIRKQVASGVKRGLQALTLSHRSELFVANLWVEISALPYYWEPPVSSVPEPDVPAHQIMAYRWAAVALAYAVRNELEPIHHGYQTKEANMPQLNKRVRNATYTTILENPNYAWRLLDYPRVLIEAHAGGAPGLRLPASVLPPSS
jgi:hypothetical protein